MSLVLYRKYRSQTFDELIGQDHVATLLKNAVSQDQTAHAYLFHGSRGLGKTSTARILAKAVNCLQLKRDGNPCCECENCKAIENGNFLDLIEIDAASNRGIDQIRELKERIEFSPSEGKFKVYIIDEVHMLTTEAFNALLKTLEEPPEHVIMILATTEIHKVPPTILSRCQRFDFRLGSKDQIRKLLGDILKKEDFQVEEDAMNLIIENARGSYRDALSLLDVVVSGQMESEDPAVITEEEVRGALGLADSTMAYFFLEKIVSGESKEALNLIEELSSKGVNLGQFVKFVLSVLRDILLGEVKGEVVYDEYSFAKKLDKQKCLKLINLFIDAERQLKDAVITTLPLEMLVASALNIFGGEEGAGVTGGGADKVDSGGDGDEDAGKDDKSTSNAKSKAKDSKESSKNKSSTKSVSSKSQQTPTKASASDETSRVQVAQSVQSEDSAKIVTKKSNGNNSKANKQTRTSNSAKDEKDPEVSKKPDISNKDVGVRVSSNGKLSLEQNQLKENWGEILEKLGDYNSHLYAFMGRAKVLGVEKGILKLAVAFDFHKDRLESVKSRDAVSKVFKDVFGCPVKISCKVDDSIRGSKKLQSSKEGGQSKSDKCLASEPAQNDVYNNVSEVFGSELVDV